jgi:GT2 family glycosyltransferase
VTPLVSAIVLNYKSYRDCVRCVEALLAQSIASELEILLIDNHSDDESIQYLRNRYRDNAKVRLIETPKNLGYGQGNAYAINQAQGEFLLIINPDNELEPCGLQNMIDELRNDATIGIVAPKLIHPDGTIRDSARKFPTLWDIIKKRTALGRWSHDDRHPNPNLNPTAVDWVAGACVVMRRSLFLELGGFDPQFFLFFEDTDLCRRVWAAGKRVVYMPSVTAKDRKERLSAGGLLSLLTKKTARIHLVSGMKYFWKWALKSNQGN